MDAARPGTPRIGTARRPSSRPVKTGRPAPLFPLRRAEIRSLYDSLHSGLARTGSKVLQLIGPQGGEGVSTIARAFAHLSASQADRRVLLLDATRSPRGAGVGLSLTSHAGWSIANAARQGTGAKDALHATANPRLQWAALSLDPKRTMADELDAMDAVLPELREGFDLIVIDSPPAMPTTEGIALASRADAVALVVEAERTRSAVAREAQIRLAEAKANLLGVIMNRRRRHIPQWLYHLL